jgi:hypothetical protein
MATGRKATLFMIATGAAVVCGLSGCSKGPSQDGGKDQAATGAVSSAKSTGALGAGLQEPPLEPPTRGNGPEVAALRDRYVQWIIDKAMPAGLHQPKFPDPNRTDRAALLQRYKFALWDIAAGRVTTAASLKEQEKFIGPAPKGNYGHIADGLPQTSSGQK